MLLCLFAVIFTYICTATVAAAISWWVISSPICLSLVDYSTSARLTRAFISAVTTTPGRQPHNQEALPRPVPKLVGYSSCIYFALKLFSVLKKSQTSFPLISRIRQSRTED